MTDKYINNSKKTTKHIFQEFRVINSYMYMIEKPSIKGNFIPVTLKWLCKKSKTFSCLPLRADNKVVPCHTDSCSRFIQKKQAVQTFSFLCFCTFYSSPN